MGATGKHKIISLVEYEITKGVYEMKTAILYYTHSGNTKALAGIKAKELGCDVEEITEVKKSNLIVAMYRGSKRKKTEIQPIHLKLDDYEKIIIMSPVWAAHPVSAVNSVIDYLPAGKKVELIMVSGGGGTKRTTAGTKELIIKRGCEVVGYTDLRAQKRKGEVVSEVLS